jgi:hypothetical protein
MSGPDPRAGDRIDRRRGAFRGDRRYWDRYAARGRHATLTWRDEGTETTIRGDLVNIGGEGASFISNAVPPPDVPLWLQLDVTDRWGGRIDPVEARLVGTEDDPSGTTIAHIRFVHACPIDLFALTIDRVE